MGKSFGKYRVMQVVLKEKLIGSGSKNYRQVERICNEQYAEGYKLHTFAQSTAHSSGLGGGDRTVCNMVFERISDTNIPVSSENEYNEDEYDENNDLIDNEDESEDDIEDNGEYEDSESSIGMSKERKICPNCGNSIPYNAAMCDNCGALL